MNPAEFFESRKTHIDEIDSVPASSWLIWNSLPVGNRLVALDGTRPVLFKSIHLVRQFFRETGMAKMAAVVPLGPAERDVLEEHFQFDEYDNYEAFRVEMLKYTRLIASEMMKFAQVDTASS